LGGFLHKFQLAEFAQRSRFVREQAAENPMNLAEGVGFEAKSARFVFLRKRAF
jgi:hypothetical protein